MHVTTRSLIAAAVFLTVFGVATVAWGLTDSDCRRHSEDVQICVGTDTGRMAGVAGGVLVGAGVTMGVLTRRRDS